MKKLVFLSIIVAGMLSVTSCEQDSLDPLPTKVVGNYMILDVYQPTLEYNFVETTAFRGRLSNPGNNVVRYELFIRRRNPNGQATSNLVPLLTLTSFPAELEITPNMIATALGVSVSDLQPGDIYRFIGYSYDAAGIKTGYNNLSSILKTTPTMKQGYKWSANAAAVINPADPFNVYTPFSNN